MHNSCAAGSQIAYISPPVSALYGASDFQNAAPAWIEAQQGVARGLLRDASRRVKDSNVEVETMSRIGSTAEELAELAAAPEVTMVVVGHRGRNLASRLLIGSVADRLVQISTKPVLVIR